MKRSKWLWGIAFLLLILFNVIFAVIIPDLQVIAISDGFILAAMILMGLAYFLGFRAGNDGQAVRSRLYGWPIVRTGITFFLASIVANGILAYLLAFKIVPWQVSLVINAALLVAAGIGLIAKTTSRNFVAAQRTQREVRMSAMKDLRLVINHLAASAASPEVQERLQRMADAFRYSDPNSNADSIPIEGQLREELKALEGMLNGDADIVFKQADKIESLLKIRNSTVLAGK